MHGLHAEHLVVALLVVEHRSCEIVEDILGGQGAVGLAVMDARVGSGMGAEIRNKVVPH